MVHYIYLLREREFINSNKNICPICDKKTNFDCLERGYYKLYRDCSSKDLIVRKKIYKSFKESFKNIDQEKVYKIIL